MHMPTWGRIGLILLALSFAKPVAALDVMTSIAPVHSIVARVMQGAGTPRLLVPPHTSPHNFSLRPTSARALDAADVVFWVGEGLETFLARPIAALAADALVVQLLHVEGVALLPYREGGPWEGHGDEEAAKDDPGHAHAHAHGGEGHDVHIWLDPSNAAAMARAIATVLAEADAANAALYRDNAAAFAVEMESLVQDLETLLGSTRGKEFIVFHDAYQYFERRFGLQVGGSITVQPQTPPSAKRLKAMRKRLIETGAACVFAEPQFDRKMARVITEGTEARIVVMDPLGAALTPGPGLYPALMRDLARSLGACVSS